MDYQIRRAGSLDDVERWSVVLTAASHGSGPGPELEAAYLRAVFSQVADGTLDPAPLWLPARAGGRRAEIGIAWARGTLKASPQLTTATSVLDTVDRLGVQLPESELRSLVDEVVLSALLNPRLADAPAQLRRLRQADRLLPLVYEQLERRLATDDLFDMVVQDLSPAAADLLESLAPRGSRCALAASLGRARASGKGRVPALLRAAQTPANPEAVERFATLLWPDPPTAEEGVQLCAGIDAAVLGKTDVPQRLVERLIEDAETAGLTSQDEKLAGLLAIEPIATSLATGVNTVDAVRWGTHFSDNPKPTGRAAQDAVAAVGSTTGAAMAVRGWTLEAVARWMLSLTNPAYHAHTLVQVVQETRSPDFLTVYRRRLAAVFASEKPARIAVVLPAIVFLAGKDSAGQQLLETDCKNALARRRKRDLDAIGKYFGERKHLLSPLLPATGRRPAQDWPSWWKNWRERNFPQSAFARFFGRRTSDGGD